MNNIFIPIKQNSERVPFKNFRKFRGFPLWRYTIEKLRPHFNIWIDTDSPTIINEVQNIENVTAYQRPEHLIGHEVSVVDIIDNFITTYNITDPICQVHVTSPLLQVEHINNSFKLVNKGFDSVFSVTKTQKRFWGEDGLPLNHDPQNLLPTQNLKVWYEENSYFYTFKPSVIQEFGNRIGGNYHMMEIGFPYNLDIDTEEDWNLVKNLE